MGVVSRYTEVNSCVGVDVDVIKILDFCPISKISVLYIEDVKRLNLEKPQPRPTHILMWSIDLFALLRSLLPFLFDAFVLNWTQSAFYLRKRSHNFVIRRISEAVVIKKWCLSLKYSEKQVLDFYVLQLIFQELTQQRSIVSNFNELRGRKREFHSVK